MCVVVCVRFSPLPTQHLIPQRATYLSSFSLPISFHVIHCRLQLAADEYIETYKGEPCAYGLITVSLFVGFS